MVEESHYGHNVRRKIGFSRRNREFPWALGGKRNKWSTRRLEPVAHPSARARALHAHIRGRDASRVRTRVRENDVMCTQQIISSMSLLHYACCLRGPSCADGTPLISYLRRHWNSEHWRRDISTGTGVRMRACSRGYFPDFLLCARRSLNGNHVARYYVEITCKAVLSIEFYRYWIDSR